MNIVIEHSKTKRKITGAFNVCGSRDDLRNFAHQILSGTDAEFHYGWVAVRTTEQDVIAKTDPVPWDEACLTDPNSSATAATKRPD